MVVYDENAGEQQLMRRASLVGNGAHIFVPKEWAGQQVILIRRPEKSPRERIIETLEPYLDKIAGAYLFGSYARGEETEESDIDLFLITNEKLKLKAEGFEIVCIEKNKFAEALKIAPIIVYSMLQEAKPIINAGLLAELRKRYKPKKEDFSEFLRESKRIIKINEEILQEDLGKECTKNGAVAYSLILRLRGVFIIKCLLAGRLYSYKSFREWVNGNVKKIGFDSIYRAYLASKSETDREVKIKIADLSKLLSFLKNEIIKMKNGKKKEKA